jgi:hypothetical protein
MDDIGDYIYLIVIAIAGLSSLLKKKKKPQGATENQERDMTGFPDLDDVIPEIREVFTPREVIVPREVVVPRPREVVMEVKQDKMQTMIPTYENQTDFTKMRSKMTLKNQKKTVFEEPEPEETKRISIALESSDDAARAFVYSEIFNRRY